MPYYFEDMLDQFNTLLEATPKPKAPKVTFTPTLDNNQVADIINVFGGDITKNHCGLAMLAFWKAMPLPGNSTRTVASVPQINDIDIPGSGLKVHLSYEKNYLIKSDDGKEYPKYVRYDKAAGRVDICMLSIFRMGMSRTSDIAQHAALMAQTYDKNDTSLTVNERDAVVRFEHLVHELTTAGNYHFEECLKYEYPKSKPTKKDTTKPTADTISADDIIRWAANADYIGSIAVPARPTFSDKGDTPSQTTYPNLVTAYIKAVSALNPSDPNYRSYSNNATVDSPTKVIEWLDKIFGINNVLTEPECVSDQHQRGTYILDRLNGKEPPKQTPPGEQTDGLEGKDSKIGTASDIINYAMGDYELLGAMADMRAQAGNMFNKERTFTNRGKQDLENDMKFNEKQSRIVLGISAGDFVRKWYPILIPRYIAVRELDDNFQPEDNEKRIVYKWLAGNEPLEGFAASAYTAINQMVWSELEGNTESRGRCLHDRILGMGRADFRGEKKQKDKGGKPDGKEDSKKNGGGLGVGKFLKGVADLVDYAGEGQALSSPASRGSSLDGYKL